MRFAKSESVITVQRDFRKQFQSDPPCKKHSWVPGERVHLQGEKSRTAQNVRVKCEWN
jgi:hypothetical protein